MGSPYRQPAKRAPDPPEPQVGQYWRDTHNGDVAVLIGYDKQLGLWDAYVPCCLNYRRCIQPHELGERWQYALGLLEDM